MSQKETSSEGRLFLFLLPRTGQQRLGGGGGGRAPVSLIIGLWNRACPAPSPFIDDIIGRSEQAPWGSQRERFSLVVSHARGFLQTSTPSSGCWLLCEAIPRVWRVTPSCQTLIGAFPSSISLYSLLTILSGALNSLVWLVTCIYITESFVLEPDISLTFWLISSCVII